MSQLLDFYRRKSRDSERRMLSDIWAWTDDRFEQCHDFIQWMFPLDEPSAVNTDAPFVSSEDREAFRNEHELKVAMRRSFARFLAFIGLVQSDDGRVVRAPNFEARSVLWKYQNHNWLRITRVLKSLRLLGFEEEAAAFWTCLKDLHVTDGFVCGNSFSYWEDAAT